MLYWGPVLPGGLKLLPGTPTGCLEERNILFIFQLASAPYIHNLIFFAYEKTCNLLVSCAKETSNKNTNLKNVASASGQKVESPGKCKLPVVGVT